MQYRVEPSVLSGGTVTVPGDKSISHRALMLSSIAEGTSRISGFLAGEDCLATLAALRSLGVRVDSESETTLVVHGVGLNGFNEPVAPLDMGNSGTAMRLFTGLLSGQAFNSRLVGDGSLSRRPRRGRVWASLCSGASSGRSPLGAAAISTSRPRRGRATRGRGGSIEKRVTGGSLPSATSTRRAIIRSCSVRSFGLGAGPDSGAERVLLGR